MPASPDANTAVCRCFEGLLPLLKPRYAELLQRIDLNGELKLIVACDLKLSRGALDVALHRARHALRTQLEIFCGACSHDSCLACVCPAGKLSISKEKV